MKNLILGILIGSALTGTVVCAGTFYDQAGKPVRHRGASSSLITSGNGSNFSTSAR